MHKWHDFHFPHSFWIWSFDLRAAVITLVYREPARAQLTLLFFNLCCEQTFNLPAPTKKRSVNYRMIKSSKIPNTFTTSRSLWAKKNAKNRPNPLDSKKKETTLSFSSLIALNTQLTPLANERLCRAHLSQQSECPLFANAIEYSPKAFFFLRMCSVSMSNWVNRSMKKVRENRKRRMIQRCATGYTGALRLTAAA